MTESIYDTMGPRGRIVRRLSPWVLVLWVSFLAMSYLQPCCESIAAALPHAHEGLPGADGGGADSPGFRHGSDGHAGTCHRHCVQSPERIDPVPLGPLEPQPDVPERAAPAAVLFEHYALAPAAASPFLRDRQRAPPQPIYLATARLRV